MHRHEYFMQRCLELASKGLGHTYPNPLVGSVIVADGKIIGEGYHTKAGEPHAEINAINSVKDKSLLKKATLYVNLEPCSHWGRTPPCAVKIAQLGIPKVIIGTVDTTAKVNGKGIEILKNANIEVITGVLEKESRQINKRFFTFHEKKRPYVILKWAQTLDGFIDIKRTPQTPIGINWITGKYERILVHKWRTEEQAILVGTNTVKFDNPQLTARLFYGKNPLRLFIDKKLQFVKNYKITDNSAKTVCFTYDLPQTNDNQNLTFVKINQSIDFLEQILQYLYSVNVQSVIVEGGARLLQSFIDANMFDEARVFAGEKFFNEGVKAPALNLKPKKTVALPHSKLLLFENEKAH